MTRPAPLFAAALLASAAPVFAQQASAPAAAPPADGEEEAEEITVIGQRDPNAVVGDIPPENQLNARDIRAYGTTSVSELLDALAPQLGSSRGRGGEQPVVLLNGRRISGFREIRDLPPEAILRLDILPEEVALKYGYRADQRVVNIVLRRRFRSTVAKAEVSGATAGGTLSGEGDVTRLLLGEAGRTTLSARVEGRSALTEDERDLQREVTETGSDPRPFRTLIGERRLARVGGTINRTWFGDVSATVNGEVERSDGRSLLGPSLFRAGEPLTRDSDNLAGRLGLALNGQKQRWRWSLTGNYELARAETRSEREAAAAFLDRVRTLSSVGSLDLTATGPLLSLPAGRVTATARVGGDVRDLSGRANRSGVVRHSDLSRDELSASMNIDVPVADRIRALPWLGDLTVNLNAEVERLSDFGTLTTLGGGVRWSPARRLDLLASWTREAGAPSLSQLGEPALVTPGSRIFDFATGQTALVDLVSGGNPNLRADSRRVLKIGATWRPWADQDLNLRADFTRSRITDPVSGFPALTDAIEAAFPARFERDADGTLIRVDLRPVNFDRSARDELRYGFNFTRRLRSARPPQAVLDRLRALRGAGEGPPPAEGGGAGPREGRGFDRAGRFGGMGGGRQGGRLNLSLYHRWTIKDEVRIARGLPTLDFLDGEVIEGGFRPRHRLEGDAGWFNNGLGARVSARWQSGGELQARSGDLRFDPLARFDLNMFANLGERFDLVEKHPWLRGTQVRIGVQNVLDARQRVRDAGGRVPLNYQADLLDPQGRMLSISLRKLFLPPRGFFRREGAATGGS